MRRHLSRFELLIVAVALVAAVSATASVVQAVGAAPTWVTFDTCAEAEDPYACMDEDGVAHKLQYCKPTTESWECETCCNPVDPEVFCTGPNSKQVAKLENCDYKGTG